MKIFLCCLMLGLTFLNYGTELTHEFASTAPQAPWMTRDGLYTLINGTDGCPNTIDWIEQCRGFVLSPRAQSRDLESMRFCQVNNGAKITRNDFGKSLIKVDQKDQYIKRVEKSLLASESITLNEDTVILDMKKQQFQWEHSEHGKGFSCLYGK